MSKINENYIRRHASKLTDKDFSKVTERAKDILTKFEKSGPLERFIKDVKVLIELVKDYLNSSYKEIPWWAISAIVFALLYVLNPFDIIPDFVPGVGYLDDAAVVALCLRMVEEELRRYKEWKDQNKLQSV